MMVPESEGETQAKLFEYVTESPEDLAETGLAAAFLHSGPPLPKKRGA